MPAWLRARRIWIVLGTMLVVVGVVVWWLRPAVTRWYCIHGLLAAAPGERDVWLGQVASLDTEAIPALLDSLTNPAPQVCANAVAGLQVLARQWGTADPRTCHLGEQLTARFDGLSLPGREGTLELQVALLVQGTQPSPRLLQAALQLLDQLPQQPSQGLQLRGMALASAVIERQRTGPALAASRRLLLEGLQAREGELRTAAIHLLLNPAFREENELYRQVLPLLRDPDAGVRRAAVLAIGPRRKLINEDELLPLLHDGDADVRRLSEAALRSRGLDDNHLLLGKLITDQRALQRLQVLEHLREASDLDPGVWLRRLTQDPAPAVRAAAIREAVRYSGLDLRERLQEMTRTDPSATVRQLAGYYLKQR